MQFTEKDVLHVAKLARLHIPVADIPMYAEQLESILAYISKLQELNLDDVPELTYSGGSVNVFRQDVVRVCEPQVRDDLIRAFPRKKGDLLESPAVFEEKE